MVLSDNQIILQTPVHAKDMLVDPDLIIVILAGVILTIALQFLLTAITIAGGISAIGNLGKQYKNLNRDSIVDLFDKDTDLKLLELEGHADSISTMVQKITKEFNKGNDSGFLKG
ncbi:MAG: hypothetical protein WBB27_11730, partial [Maribacter sp.]